MKKRSNQSPLPHRPASRRLLTHPSCRSPVWQVCDVRTQIKHMLYRIVAGVSLVAAAHPVLAAHQAREMTVGISDVGAVSFAGQTIALDRLAAELKKAVEAARPSAPEISIVASEKVPLKVLTAVMDTCRSCGISKFTLHSSQGRKSEPVDPDQRP